MKKNLNYSEKQKIKQQIVLENQMLMHSRLLNRKLVGMSALLTFLAWLFIANKINIGKFQYPIKWFITACAAILLVISILSIISFYNAKRRIKYLMDTYDGKISK